MLVYAHAYRHDRQREQRAKRGQGKVPTCSLSVQEVLLHTSSPLPSAPVTRPANLSIISSKWPLKLATGQGFYYLMPELNPDETASPRRNCSLRGVFFLRYTRLQSWTTTLRVSNPPTIHPVWS